MDVVRKQNTISLGEEIMGLLHLVAFHLHIEGRGHEDDLSFQALGGMYRHQIHAVGAFEVAFIRQIEVVFADLFEDFHEFEEAFS